MRENLHNNAGSFMHVNHFSFHPITVVCYGVIADPSNDNRLLLKIFTKLRVRTGIIQTLGVPVRIF